MIEIPLNTRVNILVCYDKISNDTKHATYEYKVTWKNM